MRAHGIELRVLQLVPEPRAPRAESFQEVQRRLVIAERNERHRQYGSAPDALLEEGDLSEQPAHPRASGEGVPCPRLDQRQDGFAEQRVASTQPRGGLRVAPCGRRVAEQQASLRPPHVAGVEPRVYRQAAIQPGACRRVLTSPEAHHSEAGKSGSPLWIDRQGLLILADRGGVFAVVSEERSVLVMRLGVPRIERYGSLDCLSCHDGCAGIAVAEQERARHPGVRRGGVLAQRAIGGGQAARQDAVGRYVFGE